MYAVFDANNFYVSCERVFNPKLNGVPVVVANPGGIVLARSNEAKALGINMAAPLFKIQEELKAANVRVIPTHFHLYGDLSQRIASIMHDTFPVVEEYSIDESFAYFMPQVKPAEIEKLCKTAREKILKWTGVPVSVGIAPTKTLAKVAVKLAKKTDYGVTMFESKVDWQPVLETFPVRDIWGVGWALSVKLPAYGINTAAQLAAQDPIQFRRNFSLPLAYTINELNGISCFTAESRPPAQKSTMVTRSFTPEITTRDELEKTLCAFAVQAAAHIRRNDEVAAQMGVFVRGNRFHKERGYLALQTFTDFAPPTAYAPRFTKFVSQSIDKLFFEGARIKRAGIYLLELQPKNACQQGLFDHTLGSEFATKNESKVNDVIDKINKKWGRRAIVNAGLASTTEKIEYDEQWVIRI